MRIRQRLSSGFRISPICVYSVIDSDKMDGQESFGMPGAILHFVERFYKNGYEKLLVESIERRPTLHTVWMLNRIINGSDNNAEYINLMNSILERKDVENEIKNSVKEFLQ